MEKLDLKTLINKIQDIPAIPNNISNLISLLENPKSSTEDIEKEILKDESITSKVLKLSNSTYYGYPRKINTVSKATILLGLKTIKSIALASTLSKVLIQELPHGYKLNKYDLWNHSQACAIICRHIAKKINFPDPEQAYIAGLLKDIGKIILNEYVAKEYEIILNKVENEKKSFSQVELEVLGFNHEQVGASIAEKWNFPENLVESILYHHNPEMCKLDLDLVSLVHVSDAITMMMGIGLGSDGLAYNFSPFALTTLNITEEFLQEIIAEVSDFIKDL